MLQSRLSFSYWASWGNSIERLVSASFCQNLYFYIAFRFDHFIIFLSILPQDPGNACFFHCQWCTIISLVKAVVLSLIVVFAVIVFRVDMIPVLSFLDSYETIVIRYFPLIWSVDKFSLSPHFLHLESSSIRLWKLCVILILIQQDLTLFAVSPEFSSKELIQVN